MDSKPRTIDEELDELKNPKAQTGEQPDEARGRTGSPFERKAVAAFEDVAKALADTNKRIDETAADLKELRKETKRIAGIADTLESKASRAVADYAKSYGDQMKSLEERSDATIEALGKLDATAAAKYEAAVEKSAGRLTRWTTTSILIIVALSLFGGLLACIGAFFSFQVFPPIQRFYEAHGWGGVVSIAVAALVVVLIVVLVVLRIRDGGRRY